MTRFSATTEFRPGWAERAERYVAAARLIVGFERVWPGLWPATGIAGLGVAAALFNLFSPLPWPLHALILACLVTVLALTLYFNLEHVQWPRWDEGARRLERDSALEHRPVSESAATLAAGIGAAQVGSAGSCNGPQTSWLSARCTHRRGRTSSSGSRPASANTDRTAA